MRMLPKFQNLWNYLTDHIFPFPSTQHMFNQYRDNEEKLDIQNGHMIRRQNLRNYLSSFTEYPLYMMIGEAPGPNGCRFTGVPFTNEIQLTDRKLIPFQGRITKKGARRAAGQSAMIFWQTLLSHHPHFIAWDCIMYHPRKMNEPLSIRTPTKHEIKKHAPHLKGIISILGPIEPVSIGRRAEAALNYINVNTIYIRHPARGGKTSFEKGVKNLFK